MVVIRENDARLRYLLRRGGTDAGFAIVSVGAGKDSWLASVPRAPRCWWRTSVRPTRAAVTSDVGRRPRAVRTRDLRPQRLAQRLAGMTAMPARRRARLVEDLALLSPVRPLVTRHECPGHCLSPAHR